MNNKDFDKIVEESISKIKDLLLSKGEEYANDKDRLSNFKDIALLQKNIPEKSLLNLVSKHIVTLHYKINNLNDIQFNYNSFVYLNKKELEKYDEYIFDIIAYMILLRGLLKERRN